MKWVIFPTGAQYSEHIIASSYGNLSSPLPNYPAFQKETTLPTHTLLPEESFSRNGTDEPLKQFARSLPAVVDSRQVRQ